MMEVRSGGRSGTGGGREGGAGRGGGAAAGGGGAAGGAVVLQTKMQNLKTMCILNDQN